MTGEPWSGSPGASRLPKDWSTRRAAVLRRDGGCVMCGCLEQLEVDHVVRYADGGSDDLSNLRTLCHSCHLTVTSVAGVAARRAKAAARYRPTERHPGLK